MKNKLIKVIVLTFLFTFSTFSYADDLDDGNGDGDVQDIPTAPISDYVPLMAFAALALVYGFSKKRLKV